MRETGWVFNNEIGDDLTLAEFVATGDDEVPAYLEAFGLREEENVGRTIVEIGSGIGRMTVAFTREFGSVIAADLDIGFLERCRERRRPPRSSRPHRRRSPPPQPYRPVER